MSDGYMDEVTANGVLAQELGIVMPSCEVAAERRGRAAGNLKPDIIADEPGKAPVVIETEYGKPAVKDATDRLGIKLTGSNTEITECIAVGIDDDCRTDSPAQFQARLKAGEPVLHTQIVRRLADGSTRVSPASPLPCSLEQLAQLCEYSQLPQAVIDRENKAVAEAVKTAGVELMRGLRLLPNRDKLIKRMRRRTGCVHEYEKDEAFRNPKKVKVCEDGKCKHDEAASRTACMVWLVAMDLHNGLAVYDDELREDGLVTTSDLKASMPAFRLTAEAVMQQWHLISEVNYLAVIEVSQSLLKMLRNSNGIGEVLEQMHRAEGQVRALNASQSFSFYGELWQRIAPNRKDFAQNYTLPPNAETLAELGTARFAGMIAEQLKDIVIMDGASGTGTLLGAGEKRIRRLYRQAGGDMDKFHQYRMENCIVALDVNPISGALTAKRLTDLDITEEYRNSRIGVISDISGSLLLEDPECPAITELLGGRQAVTAGSRVGSGAIIIPLKSVDLAIGNSPYSRPVPGRSMATHGLKPIRRKAKKAGWTMFNGQAGVASDFANMYNMRMKPGGVFAQVFPLTAAHGSAWRKMRAVLEAQFEDIIAIAIAPPDEAQSVSDETNMGELMIVATKRKQWQDQWRPCRILCVNVATPAETPAEGHIIGREIAGIPADTDKGRLSCGSYRRMTQTKEGDPWTAVSAGSPVFQEIAESVMIGRSYNPDLRQGDAFSLPMTPLMQLAEVGPESASIGRPEKSDGRGAFKLRRLADIASDPEQYFMYHSDGKGKTTIITKPTHGEVAVNDDDAAQRLIAKRTQWFLKYGLRWNSQSLAMAHTHRLCHGGAAWNGLVISNDEIGLALALHQNSIFGAAVRAIFAGRQKSGISEMYKPVIAAMPVPAFHAGTQAALDARDIAKKHFERLANLELKPFAYCWQDANRHEIDDVVAEMLGLDPTDPVVRKMLADWRLRLCQEPSVHGYNKTVMKAIAKHQQ